MYVQLYILMEFQISNKMDNYASIMNQLIIYHFILIFFLPPYQHP